MVLTILLGLIGLGVIVFVHELGHFIVAKLVHIEVESFALGWGPKIFGFTYGSTEYRINVFPIGGYCRMKGEVEFRKAIENHLARFPYAEGSLFSVSPFRRILTYFAGPLSNILFAILLFTLVWSIGYDYQTFSNRIIIGNEYAAIYGSSGSDSPAERAGLTTGDKIIALDGKPVAYFYDLQDILIDKSNISIPITYIHDGKRIESTITPELNKDTGSGLIGITAWIDPIIESIPQDSLLLTTGLMSGDIITSIDDHTIDHVLDLYTYLYEHINAVSFTLQIERNGSPLTLKIPMEFSASGKPVFNAKFSALTVHTPKYSGTQAIAKGIKETFKTFGLVFHSISLISKGLNLSKSMSGPIKITYLVGDVATKSFSIGFLSGITSIFQLLAYISIALGFTNLLPIPALDGGQIIVSLAEVVMHHDISPKNYYRLQLIGFGILFIIMIFTLTNDITYFTK